MLDDILDDEHEVDPFYRGMNAYENGELVTENPFLDSDSSEHSDWKDGWFHAGTLPQSDFLEE